MNPQNFINTAIQNWMVEHPAIAWIVNHPLWSLMLGILMLFLFWGLLNAVARFTERFWMVLLRSPLKLSQWFFRGSIHLLKPKDDPKKQLAQVLARLEELRKEEDQLIEQVKKFLASEN